MADLETIFSPTKYNFARLFAFQLRWFQFGVLNLIFCCFCTFIGASTLISMHLGCILKPGWPEKPFLRKFLKFHAGFPILCNILLLLCIRVYSGALELHHFKAFCRVVLREGTTLHLFFGKF